MEFTEIIALFLRRKWLALTVLGLTVAVNVAILRAQPDRFEVRALLKVNTQSAGTFSSDALKGMPIFEAFSLPVFVELVRKRGLDDSIRERLEASGSDLALAWNRAALRIDPQSTEGTNTLVRVSYHTPDRTVAAQVLEVAIDSIRETSQRYFEQSVERSRERFEANVNEVAAQIETLQVEIDRLRREAQIPRGNRVDGWTRSLHDKIARLDLMEVELEGQVEGARQELKRVRRVAQEREDGRPETPLELLPLTSGFPVHDMIVSTARAVIEAELKLDQVARRFTPQHPEYQSAARDLEIQRAVYASFLNPESVFQGRVREAANLNLDELGEAQARASVEMAKLETQRDRARQLRSETQDLLDKIRRYEAPIEKLLRERKEKSERLGNLQATLDGLVGASQLAQEVVTVFEPVGTVRRIGPAFRNYFLLVMMLGIVLSIASVYGVELFDHRIHNQHTLRKHVGAPCLGVIPIFKPEEIESIDVSGRSLFSEGFKSITKKVLVGLDDQKVLLVSGPDPAAGKTLASTNLAASAALLGIRTLLVDCDLRQPRVHALVGTGLVPGLTDWLIGQEYTRQAALLSRLEATRAESSPLPTKLRLRPWEVERVMAQESVATIYDPNLPTMVINKTRIPKLDVVAAGEQPDDPAALLATDRMREFIDAARAEYEFIVVDTPPLNLVSDALILSAFADQTLLVVRAGKTTSQDLHWARQGLQDVGAPVLGIVLNGLAERAPGYYSYYYGRRYYRARV